jgi:hypothetical protein
MQGFLKNKRLPQGVYFPLKAYVIAGCHSTLAAQRKFAIGALSEAHMLRPASVFRLSQIGVKGAKALGKHDNVRREDASRFKTDFIDLVRV